MKRLAVLLGALLAFNAQADTSIELGGGLAVARAQNDGVWYQKAFPYRLQLKTVPVEIGTRTTLTPWLALDARGFWLGKNTSDAWAVTNDADYQPGTPTGCGGPCPPLARFVGHGTVWGGSAMLELHTAGAWQWGVAWGPVAYHESWTLDLPQWFPVEGPNVTGPSQYNVQLHTSRWAWRQATALRLTHEDWYVSLTYYRDAGSLRNDVDFPPIWRAHTVLMVGHSF